MKIRLDTHLVNNNFFASRSKAQIHILSGEVFVNGTKELKPSKEINDDSKITIKLLSENYVSRGGNKLEKAINYFNLDLNLKICLDIGASTGGFTECLLKNGAKKVYCVDVGYGQLDYKLRNKKNVINMEKKNARFLKRNEINDNIDLIVMDVSFISITKFNLFFDEFINEATELIVLIKPQFELEKSKIGKNGVVKIDKYRDEASDNVIKFLDKYFVSISEVINSPIKGAKGNQESLIFCSNRLKTL